MITRNMLFAAATILSASAFSVSAHASSKSPHWTYEGHEGPAHWGQLSPNFKACGAGKMQSPIDLADANAESAVTIDFNYKPVDLEIINNGHTVEFYVGNGSSMTAAGKRFNLVQVHFHTPSEHPISGKPFAMEAHLVHQAADGAFGVVGLFFNEGKSNEALKDVFANIPAHAGPATKISGASVNPRSIIPANPTYYRYMGSLTTPPCLEGVNWFIVKQPIEASKAEISAMTKAFGGENARPAQDANNRLILNPAH